MAGTNRTRDNQTDPSGPAIILVEPQLGENIGMVARAMLNCGLTDLRLVRPRDGWPNENAAKTASGADMVLDAARLFDSTEDAIADLTLVFAATARGRDMTKQVATPADAGPLLRSADAGGVIFGGEAMGLNNDDVALANKVINVPLNPGFSSLNLSQAVLLVAYEWWRTGETTSAPDSFRAGAVPATKKELMHLFEHLETELDKSGFLHVEEMRPTMTRNLRNMLQRAELTDQEVRILRGVIVSLTSHRNKD
ncbi:MAG: RNA methyltransferase [Rhodospirillales bacterium]|nr:RNA methyltransferase [Rhodospirillales bacterium]